MAKGWCIRCSNNFFYRNEDGEMVCLSCGHITYTAKPLPYVHTEPRLSTSYKARAEDAPKRQQAPSWRVAKEQAGEVQ